MVQIGQKYQLRRFQGSIIKIVSYERIKPNVLRIMNAFSGLLPGRRL